MRGYWSVSCKDGSQALHSHFTTQTALTIGKDDFEWSTSRLSLLLMAQQSLICKIWHVDPKRLPNSPLKWNWCELSQYQSLIENKLELKEENDKDFGPCPNIFVHHCRWPHWANTAKGAVASQDIIILVIVPVHCAARGSKQTHLIPLEPKWKVLFEKPSYFRIRLFLQMRALSVWCACMLLCLKVLP